MPGRAFEYMNQNIGLAQSGLDRAAQGLVPIIDRNERWKREDALRAQSMAEQDRPLSEFEKSAAAQIVEKWREAWKSGQVDAKTAAIGAKVEMMGTPTQVEFAPGADSPEAQPSSASSPAAPAINPQGFTGRLMGPAGWQSSDKPPDTPAGGMTEAAQPRSISANMIDVDGPSSLPIPPSMANAPANAPMPKTQRDLATALATNQALAAWRDRGLTFEQRQELEAQKGKYAQDRANTQVQGALERAKIASNSALVRAKIAADVKREGFATKLEMFRHSVNEINNARSLLQTRMSALRGLLGDRRLDDSLKADAANKVKVVGDMLNAVQGIGEAFLTGTYNPEERPDVYDLYMTLKTAIPYQMSLVDEANNRLLEQARQRAAGGAASGGSFEATTTVK